MRMGQKRSNVIGPLKEFLEAHPGEHIKIHRLMTATGFEDSQIRNALSNARLQGYPLEVVKRGQIWAYRSDLAAEFDDVEETVEEETAPVEATDDDRGFYQLSTNSEGLPVLQRDSDGSVWIAHPV